VVNGTLERLNVEVQCDPAAASVVRTSMSRLADIDWVLGDAMLVASELVTNAVTHSGCDPSHCIQVQVYEEPDALLISVRDPGLSAPPAGDAGGEGHFMRVTSRPSADLEECCAHPAAFAGCALPSRHPTSIPACLSWSTVTRDRAIDAADQLEVTGQISRSDYEMTFNQALGSGNLLVGDTVSLTLDISAVKQA
jgi:hypothetical protein